jgi:branched-chain amino acid transport system substrate-binding protein
MSGGIADQVMAVVEQQVKDMGGILGGRQIKFVRGDDGSALAGAVGQARKLALEENVDMLAFGGFSGSVFNAVAQAAEELKIPYISPATIYDVATMKYTICLFTSAPYIEREANFVIEYVKPKTIAWLAYDDETARMQLDGEGGVVGCRERWKAAGIDIVYEQYFPQDAIDYSAYLTTIKYKNPDLVAIMANNVIQAITINKQIMELGGWGDMKVYQFASTSGAQKVVSMPAALGNYVAVEWIPGSDEPGMRAFEDAFKKRWGRSPTPDLAYYYNDFWTGIKAMELAGTSDRGKVAQAMRSGNLEWDSAWGPLRIGPDGKGAPTFGVAQVQDGGKLVKVWP